MGGKGEVFFNIIGYPKDLLKEISSKINFKDRQQQLEFKDNKKFKDMLLLFILWLWDVQPLLD